MLLTQNINVFYTGYDILAYAVSYSLYRVEIYNFFPMDSLQVDDTGQFIVCNKIKQKITNIPHGACALLHHLQKTKNLEMECQLGLIIAFYQRELSTICTMDES